MGPYYDFVTMLALGLPTRPPEQDAHRTGEWTGGAPSFGVPSFGELLARLATYLTRLRLRVGRRRLAAPLAEREVVHDAEGLLPSTR